MESDALPLPANGQLCRRIAGMLAIVFSLGACSGLRRSVSPM